MTKELSTGSEDNTKQSRKCPGSGSLDEQADQDSLRIDPGVA